MPNYLLNLIFRLGHWVRRRRFAPQLAFLRARLSPEGYLGLRLTVGALVLIGASWLFGGIAEDVITNDPLTIFDANVAAWLHEHATPTLTAVMVFISFLGSTLFVSGVVFATAVWLLWRSHWYRLATLVLAVPGGMLLNVLLKHAFRRGRPVFDDPLLTLTSYSFPSGHAMASTLLYGALAVFAVSNLKAWRWRVLAVLFAVLLIALIDFSRVFLGVHYLSDVLAGSAAGLAWLALCVTSVDTLRRHRRVQLKNTQSEVKS